jgi:hypothetical protein
MGCDALVAEAQDRAAGTEELFALAPAIARCDSASRSRRGRGVVTMELEADRNHSASQPLSRSVTVLSSG